MIGFVFVYKVCHNKKPFALNDTCISSTGPPPVVQLSLDQVLMTSHKRHHKSLVEQSQLIADADRSHVPKDRCSIMSEAVS